MARLTGEKRRFFRDSLELRLRRLDGNAFQTFVGDVLARIHRDNFVRQCPWGDKGDLSCDGYLQKPPTIFACYGAVNGTTRRTHSLEGKVVSDFEGAVSKWPDMEEWVFVTNIPMGVPAPVTAVLEALAKKHGKKVGYFGFDRFQNELLELDEDDVGDLVGPINTHQDYIRLQPGAVREAVDALAAGFSLNYLEDATAPVPQDKIEINQIPTLHSSYIRRGLLGRKIVETCVLDNADPSLDGRLSDAFRDKYKELVLQGLSPGEIVDALYDFAVGRHAETTERMTAAWAVIAYLFEKCTIFEDKPRDTSGQAHQA